MPGGAQRRRGWVTHALFDGAPVAARRAGCAHDLGLGQPRFAPSHHWLRPARFACMLIGARVFHLLRGLDHGAS